MLMFYHTPNNWFAPLAKHEWRVGRKQRTHVAVARELSSLRGLAACNRQLRGRRERERRGDKDTHAEDQHCGGYPRDA